MKTLIIITLAFLTGCASQPVTYNNPNGESVGRSIARGLVRLTTETTYYDPYLGTAHDSRVEESIFGNRTP